MKLQQYLHIIVLTLAVVLALPTFAQEKEYEWEIGAQAGIGWTYGDRNYNKVLSDAGFSFGIVSRYNASLRWSWAGELQSDATQPNRLWNLSVRPEFSFWNYGWGNDYRDKHRYAPFLTMGVSGGVLTGDSNSNFVVGIPIGIGIKYKMSPRWNMQVTALFTKTFSDRIDGMETIGRSSLVGNDWTAGIRVGFTYDFKERCIECHNQKN